MTAPEGPDAGSEQVESLLTSSELAQAIENDDYKRILDRLPIAIAVSKRAGGGQQRISYWNPLFAGLVSPSFKGESWSVLKDFVRDDGVDLGTAAAEADDFLGIFRSASTDGSGAATVEAYVGRIEDEDGHEKYRLIALVEVTDREASQQGELERQVRDKDLLLREMQHRVKNNLQLIVGLIRLEARNARRGDEVDLARLARRIEALQLLYQTLTVEGWGEEIDLGHYLSQIGSAVVRAHAHGEITLDTEFNFSPVSINIAMPVGLAVNELLTNAFKHAFPGRESGKITLECGRDGDDYRIVVADDGAGFPPGITWPVEGKLSALIVQTLRDDRADPARKREGRRGGDELRPRHARGADLHVQGADAGKLTPARPRAPLPVPLLQQRIQRAGGLAFAAFRPRGSGGRNPAIDVEVQPRLRLAHEAAEEQRRRDGAALVAG